MLPTKCLGWKLVLLALFVWLAVDCVLCSSPAESDAEVSLATNRIVSSLSTGSSKGSSSSSSHLDASSSPSKLFVNPKSTVECHRREYTFKATRTDAVGRQCWQYVTAMSCWGRCDSGEIADWRFPFKMSYHPTCIHDKKRTRHIRLKNCDQGVTEELSFYEFTEAVSCSCQMCHLSGASCEGFPFIGTRAP